MSDLISAQESVAKIVDTAIRKISSGEQKLTKEYEQSVKEAVNAILDTARRERGEAEAQAEIVRCKDCKYYIKSESYCDYLGITISDLDFCSLAGRRTDA